MTPQEFNILIKLLERIAKALEGGDFVKALQIGVKSIVVDKRLKGSTVRQIDTENYAVSPEGYRALAKILKKDENNQSTE